MIAVREAIQYQYLYLIVYQLVRQYNSI